MNEESKATVRPGYKIFSIEVVEYHYKDLDPPPVNNVVRLLHAASMGFQVSDDLKYLSVTTNPSIHVSEGEGDPKEPRLALNASIRIIFSTVNLDSFFEDGSLKAPKEFTGALVNVCLGTVRGILFAKNIGTKIGNAIMPLFDTAGFIPELIIAGSLKDVGESSQAE
ncbi:MAG: hypothetical protein ABI444_02370 [Candidatus Kapaibacterium sp.]|jgi:hypothetical protein